MNQIWFLFVFFSFSFFWLNYNKRKPALLNRKCEWCAKKEDINKYSFKGSSNRFCSYSCAFSWSRRHYQCAYCGIWKAYNSQTLRIIHKSIPLYFCSQNHKYKIQYSIFFSSYKLIEKDQKNIFKNNKKVLPFFYQANYKEVVSDLKIGVDSLQKSLILISNHFNKGLTSIGRKIKLWIIMSTPDRIRTCDPLLRRQMLYPTELPGQIIIKSILKIKATKTLSISQKK